MRTRLMFSESKIFIVCISSLFLSGSISTLAQKNLIPSYSDDKYLWGYTDKNGKVKIAYKYESASEFYGNFAIVGDANGKYLLNAKGKKLSEEPYEEIILLSNLDSSFLLKRSLGFNNETYESIFAYNIVKQDGARLFAQDYEWLKIEGKLVVFRKDGNFGVATIKAGIIVQPENSFYPKFVNGIAEVQTMVGPLPRKGFVKYTGDIVVPFEYVLAGFTKVSHGLLWGKTPSGKCQFFDNNGRKFEYMEADEFTNLTDMGWLLKLRKGNKWGVYDDSICLLECRYDLIETFYSYPKWLKIKENDKYGVVDLKANTIVPTKFESIQYLNDSLFSAKNSKGTVLLRFGGEEICVLPGEYEIYPFNKGLAKVKYNDLFGFIDKSGKQVIPVKYNNANDFLGDKVWVDLDKEFKGYIDINGNPVSENGYEVEKQNALLAEERAKEEKEKADAEREKEIRFLNTYFPFWYSDASCILRLPGKPEDNVFETHDYGTRRYVISTKMINDIIFCCILQYVQYTQDEMNKAKALRIDLLEAYKRINLDKSSKLEGLEYTKFKGLDAIKFYSSYETLKSTVVVFQKNNTLYSLTLGGDGKYFDDKTFEKYVNTFEFK